MPQEFIAGYFTPLDRPSLPGGRPPLPPITLPPLPPGIGVEPPLPPTDGGEPDQPIFIPPPITLPPGFVWPPFNPSDALQGKVLLLCWVPGAKFKWVVIDVPPIPGLPPDVNLPPIPPRPQPK